MSLTYGYDVKESGDHYVAIAQELLTLASESILPGALLVNDFPACSCFLGRVNAFSFLTLSLLVKHVPDWFPGTGFKRRARHGMKLSYEMVNAPFNTVKEDIVCFHCAYDNNNWAASCSSRELRSIRLSMTTLMSVRETKRKRRR
jgi:hypothetical protein